MVRENNQRLPVAVTSSKDSMVATTTKPSSSPAKVVKGEEGNEWNTFLERLKIFKKVKGHCRADEDADEPELGRWIIEQRRHYQALTTTTSKYSAMCHERAQKLQWLGVDLTASVSLSRDIREEPPNDIIRTTTATTTSTKSKAIKRKTKAAVVAVAESIDHPEARRPPKKRRKSLEVSQNETTTTTTATFAAAAAVQTEAEEQRDASGGDDREGGERQGVSPMLPERPLVKAVPFAVAAAGAKKNNDKDNNNMGRGDSAWETLMNVASLVPPLPIAVAPAAPVARATSSAASSVTSMSSISCAGSSIVTSPTTGGGGGNTPNSKRAAAKSKYGDLQALPNAGGSYSSKYRAANNDVVPNQQRWEDMFVRLQLYKKLHGHCRVPNRYSEDASLGSWVATQRRYFKNKNLPMPEDRVKRLTDLGFEWTTKDPRKVPWDTRFEDLKAFKKKFGHADVPHEWEECPQLGFWTANMRQQYRYKQLGKKSSLTDDRIELLNSIGFVWKMQGGRRKKSDPVARPNQNPSSPCSSDEASPPPAMSSSMRATLQDSPYKPIVLDPMSTPGMAVRSARGGMVAAPTTNSYIPPPNVAMMKQQRAAESQTTRQQYGQAAI